MAIDDEIMPTSPEAARSSRRPARWSVDEACLLAAIVALLVARIPVMAVRSFDPDEFEHCHAAWSVFRGLLPYRDFFEHHTPWFYFALSPFFRWFAVDQSFESARRFLLLGRALSLAVTALSTVLMVLVGRLGANRRVGLLAGLFLVAQPVLIQKTMEIRPDVLALPFYVGGLWFVVRGLREPAGSPSPASLRRFLGGGLCLGAAIMCTQKMLFVLPGALVGLGLWALGGGRGAWRARLPMVLIVLVGVAVPAFLTWAAFALQGGGGPFIHDNFLLNARWRLRSSRHLQVTLETSWPILVLALGGVALALRRLRRIAERRYDDVFLLCTLGGLIAGIAVAPATYKQYYLMPLAIACWFAARGLCALVDRAQERRQRWVLMGATVLLLISPVVRAGKVLAGGGQTRRWRGYATSSRTQARQTPCWTAGSARACSVPTRSTISSCTRSSWPCSPTASSKATWAPSRAAGSDRLSSCSTPSCRRSARVSSGSCDEIT